MPGARLTQSRRAFKQPAQANRVVKVRESGRKPSDSSTYDRNICSTRLHSSTLACRCLFLLPFSRFVRFGLLTGHLLGGDVEAIQDIRRGDPEN